MPLYDFSCHACGQQFEALVRRPDTKPACPSCGSDDLERLLSMPAIKSDATRSLAMRAARKRDAAQATERVSAQREYEANHD